jgi:hypothetical protein
MSEAKFGENNPMFGKSRSAENNPMFGKCHSADTKVLMSEVKNKRVFIYSKDSILNKFIISKSFDSCSDAAKYFDCTTRSI